MNRRSFLTLVSAAPLVAALKPWRVAPPLAQSSLVVHLSLDSTDFSAYCSRMMWQLGRAARMTQDELLAEHFGKAVALSPEFIQRS